MIKPKDTIYHTTVTKPKLLGRIRILFGASIVVDSEIAVSEQVAVLHSHAIDRIEFTSKEEQDE